MEDTVCSYPLFSVAALSFGLRNLADLAMHLANGQLETMGAGEFLWRVGEGSGSLGSRGR